MPEGSKFVEILNPEEDHPMMTDFDVRLEDVLADHEARVHRSRSSTQSSGKSSIVRDESIFQSPTRLKRLSMKFTLSGR
ncbi:hypothetical protein DTO166G4_2732 [Paecilomyces variotii]|nr:hypothetical protein DTO032I3_7726 [Paecilomyces variotii]KAJ9198576.1 hypothetical protein DTO164E3_5047 [Paecilomyces variotii]KAJ9215626.1 hypothetical protein DTO166G4_2732 [Paecilomyces variotii]KAJ9223730.1 hypothetical protein DTO169C6_3844 [Paecilomyces variotii]KAJ9232851.1 hypothetical protein DTO166G5_6052 [Paecilomyces variotii]